MPMSKERIIDTIQQHIDDIFTGQTFASEAALYQALGFDTATEDYKKLRRYVSKYLTWVKPNLSNGRDGTSRRIEITEIVDDASTFVPADGRRNNGGARYLYGDKVADMIAARIGKGGSFAYLPLYKLLYDIDLKKINGMQSTKYYNKYLQTVKEILRSATNNALTRLADEGMLTWTPCYFLSYRPKFFDAQFMRGVFITDPTIADFILNLLELSETENVEQEPVVQEIQAYINQIPNGKDGGYLSFNHTKLLDCLKGGMLGYEHVNWLSGRCMEYLDADAEDDGNNLPITATESEAELIRSVNDTIALRFGYGPHYLYDAYERQRVYECSAIVFKLFGWEQAWHGLSITDVNNEAHQITTDYSDLHDILEKRIAESVANKHRNDEEEKAARHTFGNHNAFRNTMPEYNIYYMADSEEINKLHYKLFGLEENGEYLKAFIRQ